MARPRLTLLLGLAACGGEPARPSPVPAPPPSSSVAAGAPLPPGVVRALLPAGQTPPVTLRRVAGDGFALATVEAADRGDLWVRALGEAGPVGAPLRLEGAQLATALALGDDVVLVLSRGAELCVRTGLVRGDAKETCTPSGARAVHATQGGAGDPGALFLVDLESPPQRAVAPSKRPPPKAPKAAPKKPPPRKAGPKKKAPGAKPGGKPGPKPGAAARPKPRAPAAPREPSKLVVRRWTRAAGFEEPRQTGLSFVRPQAGLDVVSALGSQTGGWVAFYEPGKKPKGPMGSARIAVAELDAAGALVGKPQPLAEGELEWGGVKGLYAPRLVSMGVSMGKAQAALASLTQPAAASRDALPKGSCALAHLAGSPAARQGAPTDLACSLGALEGWARGDALDGFAPLLRAARRVEGQAASDPPNGAWAGKRWYFLERGRVRSATAGEARDEAPFRDGESALAGASLAPDGEALVALDGRMLRVAPGGAVAPAGAFPSGVSASFARVGGAWLLARGAPQLAGSARPAADEDAAVLVGGPTFGWGLSLARTREGGTDLDVRRVAEDASSAPAFTVSPAPVAAGFAAALDGRGGVLLVGASPADPARLVSARLDAQGKLEPPVALGARLQGLRRIELASAGRAVLVWLPDSGEVLWLDDAGRELGAALAPKPSASCPGFPADRVPSAQPGAFEALPGVGPAACTVGLGAFQPRAAVLLEREGLGLRGSYVRLPLAGSPAAPAPAPALAAGAQPPRRLCPPDMVYVPARDEVAALCVDRFESVLVQASGDAGGGRLSPDYSPASGLLDAAILVWSTARERTGDLHAQALALPLLPGWQRQTRLAPLALARAGDRPNGYVTGFAAEQACGAAGKRLCTQEEFVLACRGEKDTLFPYGDDLEDGACNVFRERHPAALLHGNASIGHLDPRLNRVPGLFARAGSYPRCRSVWGDDAIYDMVGNLDEWLDDAGGAFAGGFYARSTRSGCEALIDAHPRAYADYSTGVRCCRSREP